MAFLKYCAWGPSWGPNREPESANHPSLPQITIEHPIVQALFGKFVKNPLAQTLFGKKFNKIAYEYDDSNIMSKDTNRLVLILGSRRDQHDSIYNARPE